MFLKYLFSFGASGLWLLRKHAYSKIKESSPLKRFSDKNLIVFFFFFFFFFFFIFLLKTLDCESNDTRNLWFWAKIRKKIVYSCKPQFYYIKVDQNYTGVFSGWFLGHIHYYVCTKDQSLSVGFTSFLCFKKMWTLANNYFSSNKKYL